MLILPGATVFVSFEATAGGVAIALMTPTAVVIRDGTDTTVPAPVQSPALGRYLVSFITPVDWNDYERVDVRLTGSFNGISTSYTKTAGQIITELRAGLDLLQADEDVTPTRYRKLKQGTQQLLLDKDVSGDGQGNLTITERP